MQLRRALLSVSDKRGLIELARGLLAHDIELLASGGTARVLHDAGLAVTEVADYTGSPEILDGRVKTLHPKIHAGILARRDVPEDVAQLAAAGWGTIDLVIVNLYPFRDTVTRAYGTWPAGTTALTPEIIEQIDIGGPTLLRAAAKNHAYVVTICDPDDYPALLEQLTTAQIAPAFAQQCAGKVFAHTAQYDAAIAQYFSQAGGTDEAAAISLQRTQSLRYGENPHQSGQWSQLLTPAWIGAPVQGKELSYNNLLDIDAAVLLANDLTVYPFAVAIIKHGNPCGVGIASASLAAACARAWEGDPLSAFGGIVVCTRPLDGETARLLQPNFVEVIVAPGFTDDARAVLAGKTALRLVPCTLPLTPGRMLRSACGGVLQQQADVRMTTPAEWRCATRRAATADEVAALDLAWRVCKHVRSNAIVLTDATGTVGVGAGQMSRVDSVNIAVAKAAGRPVLAAASDAFFPFADGVEALLPTGLRAIVHPGGAKRDADVIAVADAAGAAMYLTGFRHFKH